MAGSILGQDQIRKVNAAYAPLMAHIRALLAADRTPYGLMKVHFLVEGLDSDEMYRILSPLSFLSPTEKRALVRAAVYEVICQTTPAVVVTADLSAPVHVPASSVPQAEAPTVFSPPQFKLNITKAEALRGDAKDTPPPAPVVTNTAGKVPTALEVIPALKAEAAEINGKSQAQREAAVARLRESTAPAPVEAAPMSTIAEKVQAIMDHQDQVVLDKLVAAETSDVPAAPEA